LFISQCAIPACRTYLTMCLQCQCVTHMQQYAQCQCTTNLYPACCFVDHNNCEQTTHCNYQMLISTQCNVVELSSISRCSFTDSGPHHQSTTHMFTHRQLTTNSNQHTVNTLDHWGQTLNDTQSLNWYSSTHHST
jgi:hypothetical protein